jgi:hypothetical protein
MMIIWRRWETEGLGIWDLAILIARFGIVIASCGLRGDTESMDCGFWISDCGFSDFE